MPALPLRAPTRFGIASPDAVAALQILDVWRRNAFAIPHLIRVHEFPRRSAFIRDIVDDGYGRGIEVIVHRLVDHGLEQQARPVRVPV